jgi:hypothetical protein
MPFPFYALKAQNISAQGSKPPFKGGSSYLLVWDRHAEWEAFNYSERFCRKIFPETESLILVPKKGFGVLRGI